MEKEAQPEDGNDKLISYILRVFFFFVTNLESLLARLEMYVFHLGFLYLPSMSIGPQ